LKNECFAHGFLLLETFSAPGAVAAAIAEDIGESSSMVTKEAETAALKVREIVKNHNNLVPVILERR
jgi:hypothetical protein